MRKPGIETFTGKRVLIKNTKPKSINIYDIARGLAMTVRFNGQLDDFFCVGQHCINVKNMLKSMGEPPPVQMYGLLHDAPEFALGDLVRPVKIMLPSFKKLETGVMKAVLKALGLRKQLALTKEQLKSVKFADNYQVIIERLALKSAACKKNGWNDFGPQPRELGMDPKAKRKKLICMSWKTAEKKYLKEFKKLKAEL
jgi:5'-deoxynucleotidase YfbR-like HD superfamily hydrolase